MREAGDLSFIDALRCEDDYVSIKVKKMTARHANFWHLNIQKIIDREYCHATSGKNKKIRADVSWNWIDIKKYLDILTNLSIKNTKAELYCIVLKTEDLKDLPIGMLAAVPKYHCKIHNKKEPRSFVWFFSDAPVELYEKIGMKKVSDVPKAAIDTTIVSSHHHGLSMEIFLRCAIEGGEKLKKFYAEKCGMEQLTSSNFNPGLIRKILGHSLDSFYYLNTENALTFSKNLRHNNNIQKPTSSHHKGTKGTSISLASQMGESS